tara:strand:+ start:7447 stop:7596 length:150 start_codon:yes stop_codon:yes gene_type:complete
MEDEEYDEVEDSAMSYTQQTACDRSDYANEMVRSGKWSKEQAAEYKIGA